jgi:hypothetical protein
LLPNYSITKKKITLHSLDTEYLKNNPPSGSCFSSLYNYSLDEYVITGDVNIVNNEDLRSLVLKSLKYREPKSFNWHRNFRNIVDYVENCTSRWAKYEKKRLTPSQNGLNV